MKGVFLIVLVSLVPSLTSSRACDSLEQSLGNLLRGPDVTSAYTVVRRVELESGTDGVDCLNAAREQEPPPCGTLGYAIQRTPNTEVASKCS